jgi:hypothetical protein
MVSLIPNYHTKVDVVFISKASRGDSKSV